MCAYCLIAAKFRRGHFISIVIVGYVTALCLFYYVYQFALDADILQLPYYLSYAIPAVFLSIPLIFSMLWADVPKHQLKKMTCLGVTGFVLPWILKASGLDLLIPSSLFWHSVLLASVTGLALLAAVGLRLQGSVRLAFIGACTMLIGLSFAAIFSDSYYTSIYQSDSVNRRREWNEYRVAMQFMDLRGSKV